MLQYKKRQCCLHVARGYVLASVNPGHAGRQLCILLQHLVSQYVHIYTRGAGVGKHRRLSMGLHTLLGWQIGYHLTMNGIVTRPQYSSSSATEHLGHFSIHSCHQQLIIEETLLASTIHCFGVLCPYSLVCREIGARCSRGQGPSACLAYRAGHQGQRGGVEGGCQCARPSQECEQALPATLLAQVSPASRQYVHADWLQAGMHDRYLS